MVFDANSEAAFQHGIFRSPLADQEIAVSGIIPENSWDSLYEFILAVRSEM
ncbi:hypothetical protein [Breznakiella homolactica]|uniref:Uncharacterized protein n=1 Tax=Breznakiella homolactica TaxID=2798577 RepID=A0A7T7XM17_9SPIR|nr:hypothetical protein [Breznakiella homolactica]QQO08865.1 hypothetical protein JFL75_18340 [Breznakiella homolactica]